MTEGYRKRVEAATDLQDKEVFHKLLGEGFETLRRLDFDNYDLGGLLNVSESTISRWQHKESTPRLTSRERILQKLAYTTIPLMARVEAKALIPGDELFYKSYGQSCLAKVISRVNPRRFSILLESRSSAISLSLDTISRSFSIVKRQLLPHICPYCRASAFMNIEILHCNNNCEGARNEQRAAASRQGSNSEVG